MGLRLLPLSSCIILLLVKWFFRPIQTLSEKIRTFFFGKTQIKIQLNTYLCILENSAHLSK